MSGSRWTWRWWPYPGSSGCRSFPRPLRGAGGVRQPGHALAAGPALEPAGLERGLRPRHARELLGGRPVLDRLAPDDPVRRACAGLSLLVGYPVAYFTAARGTLEGGDPARADPPAVDQLPDADAGVDQPAGAGRDRLDVLHTGIEDLFLSIGLLDEPGGWLNGQPVTVILALYGYIPFFILPLFVAIDRIDRRQIDAARDLGASPASAFPGDAAAVLPGILAGAVLIALPMFGDYYTADRFGVDADEHDREPDRRVHATGVGEGDRRGADAALVDVPARADVLLPARPAGRAPRPRYEHLAQPVGQAALPRALHGRLHPLVGAPGADRDRVRVQRRALAHDLAGLLDPLVHRRDRQRAPRRRAPRRARTRCFWPSSASLWQRRSA